MCDNYHLEPESHGTCQGAVPVEAQGFSGLGYLPKHLDYVNRVHHSCPVTKKVPSAFYFKLAIFFMPWSLSSLFNLRKEEFSEFQSPSFLLDCFVGIAVWSMFLTLLLWSI